MLDSLDIKNFRNLKELRLESLARVNLITGKNNTGKSTILEAIAIYATKGSIGLVYQLLRERGEDYNGGKENQNTTESNVRSLASLFSDRLIGFDPENSISIGSVNKEEDLTVSLRFVRYFDDVRNGENGIVKKRILVENEVDAQQSNLKIGLEIKVGDRSVIRSLDDGIPNVTIFYSNGSNDNIQFIRTRNIDRDTNGKLWDSITLTEKENYVIEALKIIEPSTERIAFVETSSRERSAVIKLADVNGTLPLRSMGDGINRILTIILALVNSDNGFLLIDEFENGLHYTVQEQLWDIIFKLAEKLNVQVFVTTHSEDCIKGFEQILNSDTNSEKGKLIRLDNTNGAIKQVEFNAQELKIATDHNIETR